MGASPPYPLTGNNKKELVQFIDDAPALFIFWEIKNALIFISFLLFHLIINLEGFTYHRQAGVAPAMAGDLRPGMNRAGGVGVSVRPQALTPSDNMACAAGANSLCQTLSYSHPHVLVTFAPKVTSRKVYEQTVGRTLLFSGNLDKTKRPFP